jgi:hypothetical protein
MSDPIPVAVCPGLPIEVGGYKLSVPGSVDGVRNSPPWDGQIARLVAASADPPSVQVLGSGIDETVTWGADEYTTQLAGGLAVLRLTP